MHGLEEFPEGRSASLTVEVTEAAVAEFVRLSGDDAPFHTDPAAARAAGFRGRLVHGALLGSFVSRLVGTILPGPRSVLQRMDLTFRRPVVAPAALELKATVKQVSPAVRSVRMAIEVRDGTGALVASGETSHSILAAAPAAPPGGPPGGGSP